MQREAENSTFLMIRVRLIYALFLTASVEDESAMSHLVQKSIEVPEEIFT